MFRPQLSLSGFAFIAALILSCGAAFAEPNTSSDKYFSSANYVMPGCRYYVSDNGRDHLFLQGLCGGAISGLRFLNRGSCVPAEASWRQIVHVVVQYIDSRPERMHEDFRVLAVEAMNSAWPCGR
jgi:Rap1a immunity proteins